MSAVLQSASREYEQRCSLNDQRIAAEEFAAEEIRYAFSQRGKVALQAIAVPTVGVRYSGQIRVTHETLSDVLLEVIQSGYVDTELLELLEKDEGELAVKLRAAICEKWISQNASDIAEARL